MDDRTPALLGALGWLAAGTVLGAVGVIAMARLRDRASRAAAGAQPPVPRESEARGDGAPVAEPGQAMDHVASDWEPHLTPSPVWWPDPLDGGALDAGKAARSATPAVLVHFDELLGLRTAPEGYAMSPGAACEPVNDGAEAVRLPASCEATATVDGAGSTDAGGSDARRP